MQRLEVRDRRVRGDLDADGRDVGDVLLHDLGREAVSRDRETEEAAGYRSGFEDLHAVAAPGELPGRGESGGPGADNGHPLAASERDFDIGSVGGGVVLVGGEALEPPDRQ